MSLCLNALVTRQFEKLSLGVSVSRTAVRLNHTRRKRRQRVEPDFQPGHGEKIWIFHHLLKGMTANRALEQIPFNGKKMRPTKLRKDYWRPLAMIQLPVGYGEVGRSVYQRLRECKRLHELSWTDEVLYDRETNRTLKRGERGHVLNNQRANTVADVAAVLGGLGKGNKMRPELITGVLRAENHAEDGGDAAAAVAARADAAIVGEAGDEAVDSAAGRPARAARVSDLVGGLLKATVFWADPLHQRYAEEWPDNVTHSTFEEATLKPRQEGKEEAAEEEGVEEEEPTDGDDGDGGSGSQRKAPADYVANEELSRAAEQQQTRGL
ncbi:hypothetical protein SLS62_006590 [Diatrype stigma]|uniref:Large ribosomal subunit protein mL67 n=1 Tax=Diatrype stigma TaxID=117547 RepID=A0AAN9YMR1_9PEZI